MVEQSFRFIVKHMNAHAFNSSHKFSIRDNPILIIVKELKSLSRSLKLFLNFLIDSFYQRTCNRILIIVIKRESVFSLHDLIDLRRLIHIGQRNCILNVFKKMLDLDERNVVGVFERFDFLKDQVKVFFC